jgi:diguanylate cyclase (GGDEF)-like protein
MMLVITAIFSAYFNHSRITILSGLFLFLALSEMFTLPWSQSLKGNESWLLLQNLFLLISLSFLKDRGLLSTHGIYRAFLLIIFAGFASAWQSFDTWAIKAAAQGELGSLQFMAPWLSHLLIDLPLFITLMILLLRSLTRASLFAAALFITGLFLMMNYYQISSIAWQVSYLTFAIYYLLVVIVESYFLAYRDDLTGLPSRRALNQLALSLGRKYTVAMLDIDHFKKFNDTYGHDIGDQVLKLVAARIGEVKDGGKPFRYGGEEFTIVFPRKEIEQVLTALEDVRQAIQDYDVVIRNPERTNKEARQTNKPSGLKKVSVTISIGVATRENKQAFSEVLKVADEALYRAKKKGRNNVSK